MEVTAPHRGTMMLERDMAPGRLAKARQRLKRAVSHQRCQGGALVAMVGCPHDPCMRRV